MHNADSLDAEDEFEIHQTTKYVKLGDSAYARGDFAKAEAFYQKAWSKQTLLDSFMSSTQKNRLGHQFSKTLLKQEKAAIAAQICHVILKDNVSVKTDDQRLLVLTVSTTLAEAHLQSGDIDEASHRCYQSLTALHRLLRDHPDATASYHNAIALMCKICELQNEPEEAAIYADELPDNYEMPVFKVLVSYHLMLNLANSQTFPVQHLLLVC